MSSSRDVSTSSQNHDNKNSSQTPEQASNHATSISIDHKELTCPITNELFFDPVLAMPCGHGFENRASGSLLKGSCPECRQDIVIFGAALDKRRDMDKVLSLRPELYAQVYFNLDHFAEIVEEKGVIVKKNQLTTPIGVRFIKLLQHAANHLNDKAVEGVQKGKNAIEILASTQPGRELLRKDEKIRALISKESLQLKVNDKTIQEWLSLEEVLEQKEQKSSQPAAVSTNGLFASNAASSSVNPPARQAAEPAPADTVWQRVAYGNEDGALQMLRANPRLVEQKGTVISHSGRALENDTPYQIAIREGDEEMAEKIKTIYLEHDPQNVQAILDAQFNEVFPHGHAAHLEAQKAIAAEFERTYLNPLVDAITNASRADLQAALAKRDNGSTLCSSLRTFKEAVHTLAHQEKVFNPYLLDKVFAKRNEKFDAWYVNDQNPDRWLRLDLLWCQGVGREQRYLPANYMQAFCTGLGNINDGQALQRTFTLHNDVTNRDINIFPLDADPDSKLGDDFGVYSYYGRGAWGRAQAGRAAGPVALYKTYVEQKQQNWGAYATRTTPSPVPVTGVFNSVRRG